MSDTPSATIPNSQSQPSLRASTACTLAWLLAVALTALVFIWPLARSMVAANDDLKFFRGEAYSGTLIQNIRAGWTTQSNFRPLENIAALLCDEYTLECRGVLVIQFAGLLALFAALRVLTRRLLPQHPIALPLLMIWIIISPATTGSLWQMDSCSQTWTAALGVWTGVLAIAGIDAARAGRFPWTQVLILLVICSIASNIKELFYGWSAGVGTTVIIALLWLMRRERAAAWRAAWLLLPIAVIPAAHLTLRWFFSALRVAAEPVQSAVIFASEEASRYKIGLGANLFTNAWVSMLGLFAGGPLHLVRDGQAPIILRLLPLASLVAAFIAITAAGLLAIVHRDPARAAPRRALLLAAFGGIASLSVTLPMGSVSELYGFGANAASGLLVIAALLALWHPRVSEERALCRAIAMFCGAVIVICGVYGVASRAYHFDITWTYARQINHALLTHQQSLPAIDPQRDEPARVFFEQPCLTGPLHSQYIIPPILGIGLETTQQWMNRRDPTRPVRFYGPRTLTTPRPTDLVITCEDLPTRRRL